MIKPEIMLLRISGGGFPEVGFTGLRPGFINLRFSKESVRKTQELRQAESCVFGFTVFLFTVIYLPIFVIFFERYCLSFARSERSTVPSYSVSAAKRALSSSFVSPSR